jgi:hypothetical protein
VFKTSFRDEPITRSSGGTQPPSGWLRPSLSRRSAPSISLTEHIGRLNQGGSSNRLLLKQTGTFAGDFPRNWISATLAARDCYPNTTSEAPPLQPKPSTAKHWPTRPRPSCPHLLVVLVHGQHVLGQGLQALDAVLPELDHQPGTEHGVLVLPDEPLYGRNLCCQPLGLVVGRELTAEGPGQNGFQLP